MSQTTANAPMFRLAACMVALACLLVPPADAQSDASLRQSDASLMASVEVPVAVFLSRRIGLDVVWIAYPIAFVAMMIFQATYYRLFWRKKPIERIR